MMDLLRLHVVWDADSQEGARIAERISSHFDGIGMERDGVAHRVPVRFSSTPWEVGSALPKAIDLDRAQHNAVILLHDDEMYNHREAWDTWATELRARMDARSKYDVYVAFGSTSGAPILPSDEARRTQYQRRKHWDTVLDDEARDSRLLLLLLIKVRAHLRAFAGADPKEPIFVSHAKADGDKTARAIVDYINNSSDGVPLETFYDATELMPGDDYGERFKEEIGRGTLLAIVSDVYDSRPWCVFELTEAKRRRRPIVLADIGDKRTSRTYPYGANLPRVRIRAEPGDTSWIERLLVETMSKGLRCALFERQANQVSPGALVLPRPPELFDVIDREDLSETIIYPDPPLGEIEASLLHRALKLRVPGASIKTLGELT